MNTIRKGYKQTEVGVIPEDWEVKKIDSEIDLLTGYPFKSDNYKSNGIKLLRGSNIKRGVTDWNEDITQYWIEITSDLKPYILNDGDIVIAMDGSLVGKSFARLTYNDLPALLLQRVARIRSSKVDVGYLKEFICSEFFTKYCDTVKTSSAIPHISPKDIREFSIPIPPTKFEQTAIATALSDADALISSLEKLIAKKRAIKQGAMQELLKPKQGWEVSNLSEAVEFLDGQRRPIKSNERKSGEYPYYGASGIIDYVDNYIFDDELILLGEDGENIISRNLPLAFMVSGKIWVNNHAHVLKPKEQFDIKYLTGYLESLDYSLLNSGTAQPKLNKQACLNIKVSHPNILEQTRIATILSDMDAEIAGLEEKLSKYKMVKQGMMQELLTGRVRLVD